MRTLRIITVAVLAGSVLASTAEGQRRRGTRGMSRSFDHREYNVDYNGRFTFVRLRYHSDSWRGGDGWAHDYPTAEQNFGQILREVSLVDARADGTNILTFDDPDIFRYPMAYLSEPGYWSMSEDELTGFRDYLLKGGFMIVDDFRDNQWYNFESEMLRAFPDLRAVRLDASHPIFNTFFHIESLDGFYHPYSPTGPAEFYGYFEDNDPQQRMLVIANYNNDIGDYMEFSATGWVPIELSNEAYKLGVNYLIYSMTR